MRMIKQHITIAQHSWIPFLAGFWRRWHLWCLPTHIFCECSTDYSAKTGTVAMALQHSAGLWSLGLTTETDFEMPNFSFLGHRANHKIVVSFHKQKKMSRRLGINHWPQSTYRPALDSNLLTKSWFFRCPDKSFHFSFSQGMKRYFLYFAKSGSQLYKKCSSSPVIIFDFRTQIVPNLMAAWPVFGKITFKRWNLIIALCDTILNSDFIIWRKPY